MGVLHWEQKISNASLSSVSVASTPPINDRSSAATAWSDLPVTRETWQLGTHLINH
jgi:hypothetical protein